VALIVGLNDLLRLLQETPIAATTTALMGLVFKLKVSVVWLAAIDPDPAEAPFTVKLTCAA